MDEMDDHLRVPRDFGLHWLDGAGPESDVVVSTRVRLARNLADRPMPQRASEDDRERVLRAFEAVKEKGMHPDAVLVEMVHLDDRGRRLLLERRAVTRELVGEEGAEARIGAALVAMPGDALTVMVNEEDHLRLQCLVSGLRLAEAWDEVDELDTRLGFELPIAFRPDLGYLTACPTNTGTGLRASTLVHLPGLVLTREIERVLHGIGQVGLTFRGLYGEGSEVVGNFFQISNQTTLGVTEEDSVQHLERVIRTVIEKERQAREVLRRDAGRTTRDKVSRASGLLRYARILTFEELMNLASGVRMGVSMGLLEGPSLPTLNGIMIFAQAAHLDDEVDGQLSTDARHSRRAAFVRRALEEEWTPPTSGDAP